MSDPFFAPVKKSGGGSSRGSSRGGSRGSRGGSRGRGGRSGDSRAINPKPKLDTGKKNRATTSMAGKRKHRGDSDDEDAGSGARRSRKGAVEDDDEGGDEIGAGGIDDMDLDF